MGIALYVWTPAWVAAAAEGVTMASHVYKRYKEKKESLKTPKQFALGGVLPSTDADAAVMRERAVALGVITAGELVAAPHDRLTLETCAVAAQTVGTEFGLDITVMGRPECENLGIGSFLGRRWGLDRQAVVHPHGVPAGERLAEETFVH